MKITMIERPRQSGKSTLLKLKVHESIKEYDVIVVLGHSVNSTAQFREYFRKYYNNIRFSLKSFEYANDARCLVLIDEPFLLPSNIQEEMYQILKKANQFNDITLWGIGSAKADNKPIFEQFINKEIK